MVRLLEGCVLSFSPNQVEREREHPIMRELQNDQSEIYPGELSLKSIFMGTGLIVLTPKLERR